MCRNDNLDKGEHSLCIWKYGPIKISPGISGMLYHPNRSQKLLLLKLSKHVKIIINPSSH